MRVICISDTHSLHWKLDHAIPDGDLLIHAGDITSSGDLADVKSFNQWIGHLPHPHKIVIAGNHDFCFERNREVAQGHLSNCRYLQDSEVVINGIKIYGSPWQPWFFDWAFNLERGEPLARVWKQIPIDTDILVTHGPPFGILDKTARGEQVGCKDLLERIEQIAPRLHVFGHIHEAYGKTRVGGTTYVNASVCNLNYVPCNAPIVVDL